MTTERPIIFSAPMVRALLEGRKTQTRRIIRKPPSDKAVTALAKSQLADVYAPYQPGDRLWVKEPYAPKAIGYFYTTDVDGTVPMKFNNSMFMPRIASRLTLTITAVKVERLQEISEEDAKAEGVKEAPGGMWSAMEGQAGTTPRAAYGLLWNHLHGKGAWDANPWVAAISFTIEKP